MVPLYTKAPALWCRTNFLTTWFLKDGCIEQSPMPVKQKSLVKPFQLALNESIARTKARGLTLIELTFTVQCKWGPVARPVAPANPTA
jgi:hypothetical protein